jgi:hypothetical protein
VRIDADGIQRMSAYHHVHDTGNRLSQLPVLVDFRLDFVAEIFAADGYTCLTGSPNREGAPVGEAAETKRQRFGKLVITMRDLLITQHRILV